MVNPVKAFSRLTGLSSLTDSKDNSEIKAVQDYAASQSAGNSITATTPPPQAAPLVGQDPTPKRNASKPRQFAPAIIGSGAGADSGSGGKTLLGQ